MAKKKIYAVRKGTAIGVFETWAECQEAVTGFSNAEYKSFSTLTEAESYLSAGSFPIKSEEKREQTKLQLSDSKKVKAYVDGSFDESLQRYSYGLLLIFPDGSMEEYSDFGEDKEGLASRNVSGELLGAMIAIEKATNLGYESILIMHDYRGIADWATGAWKASKVITIKYVDFINQYKEKISIDFEWVKGHSGDKYNDLVDRLAKDALRKDHKPKFGDNSMVVNNVRIEDIEAIMEIIEEDDDYSIFTKKNNDSEKTTWQLLLDKEKLVAIHYTKKRKLLIQGKPAKLFSILSSFVLELVDSDQVVEAINPVYEIEIDKELVNHEYNVYLPNKNIDFTPKLDNTIKQAIYNIQLSGDMYDHTYLSFPALRGLEGFMKLILKKYRIDCEKSFHCFVEKDKSKETYKLDPKYEKNIGSPKKIQYLNKLYDYYRKHRHTLFHWDEIKPGQNDTTRVLNENSWKIIITDTLDLMDNYFTTN